MGTTEVATEDADQAPQCQTKMRRCFCISALFCAFLVSNVGQRVAFKKMGYVLGPYPYFILVSISASFVPIFAVICAVIVVSTGGWLPTTQSWRTLGVFTIIGACNAFNGAGMVFANPHVPGFLQALLQQAVIPMTLALSVLLLHAKFSLQQYLSVLVIAVGIGTQLGPSMSSKESTGDSNTDAWIAVFLAAQTPLALGAIVQEKAFSQQPVNVFHMMFWASLAQFSLLICMAPLDTVVGDALSWQQFQQNFEAAWRETVHGDACVPLVMCIVTMLLSQLTQVLMVKHSSAAFTVVCMAFVMPSSAVAFTSTAIMGGHAEHLSAITCLALLVVFAGIIGYRFGEFSARPKTKRTPSARVPLLHEPSTSPSADGTGEGTGARCGPLADGLPPTMLTVGVGLVASEYSNARGDQQLSVFEECTMREIRLKSDDAPARGGCCLPRSA